MVKVESTSTCGSVGSVSLNVGSTGRWSSATGRPDGTSVIVTGVTSEISRNLIVEQPAKINEDTVIQMSFIFLNLIILFL